VPSKVAFNLVNSQIVVNRDDQTYAYDSIFPMSIDAVTEIGPAADSRILAGVKIEFFSSVKGN